MDTAEARKLASDIRKFADFIELRGKDLPAYPSFTIEARCWLNEYDSVKNETTGEWENPVNEAKTKENLAEFLRAIGSCEKEYNDDRLRVVKKFGKAQIIGTVDRSLTCKKVVKGTKIIPAYSSPEREVEDYEWECDDAPSLLALVKE